MRTVTQLTSNRFVNVHKVVDPEKNCKGYEFASRKGIDSVAFICVDKDFYAKVFGAPKHVTIVDIENPDTLGNDGDILHEKAFLWNREFTPPIDDYLFRAFGGSMDKEVSPEEIVKFELKEECGFDEAFQIMDCGKVFVSTQMDQFCHLFLVLVDRTKQGERMPENAMEAMATPTWVSSNEIVRGSDWKAITILAKQHLIFAVD